ncbi:MAG: serine hydrolase domain-containing protein, partial [Armatimonadota bacterium]
MIRRVVAGSRWPAPPPAIVDLSAIPMTGTAAPEYAPFDDAVLALLRDEGIPGAALAVARQGRLVLSRGYGVVERGTRQPVDPGTRFRIASVAKPITAVAALALIDDRRDPGLLDAPLIPALGIEPWLPGSRKRDPRLDRVTLRMVLRHRGGWDRAKSFDPMFRSDRASEEMGVAAPISARDMARWGLGFPLDFDPGSRFAYSNFGYCLIGRWIEAVSGRSYERFVRERVLGPLGLGGMEIGREGKAGRLPGETAYHMPANDPRPDAPYVSIHPKPFDSHGGWVASAPELVRFADGWDQPAAGVVSKAAVGWALERPAVSLTREKDGSPAKAWQGFGWMVRPTGGGANLWHEGTMAGTSALVVRLASGTTWALLLNQRTEVDVD